jgi:hypothetical protein
MLLPHSQPELKELWPDYVYENTLRKLSSEMNWTINPWLFAHTNGSAAAPPGTNIGGFDVPVAIALQSKIFQFRNQPARRAVSVSPAL